MTKINKLVMQGFKSFAKRTELVFGDNFNCVLGPNGSGKSNILDALCFVLGRLGSKSLRAEKSANLIYNGGKSKKPMLQGEVSIFFDNEDKTFPTEDPYVKVTRIIKKDGQSVYKINDEKRTRQQIIDLLSIARIDPDGFNIILQGDIVRFTEMHGNDRREIIEGIAGISVYEDKKHKALRELEKVDERLKEAEVILAERNRYLKELQKEKDQAMKFKELEGQIKTSKASYLHIQIERQQKKKDVMAEKMGVLKEKLDKFNEEIADRKKEIEEKKGTIDAISKDIEEKGEKEQVHMQKEVESLKIELATNKTRLDNCRSEIEKIALRKKQFAQEIIDLDGSLEDLKQRNEELNEKKESSQKELEAMESRIQKFKDDNAMADVADIEEEIDKVDAETEELQKSIEETRGKQQDLIRKKDSLEYQIQTVDEKMEKVKEIERDHKDQIDSLKEKKTDFKNAIEELNKRLNEDSSLAVQISEKRQLIAELQKELAKFQARSESIKEHSSKSLAVKSILDLKEKGVYGTVSGLGNVNSKHAAALDVAAGPRINSIVVDTDKTAADMIQYLKRNKLGFATFLPMNKMKDRGVPDEVKALKSEEGVIGLALDLVSYDPQFRTVFGYVFGSTLVVKDIQAARTLGIGKARMVTQDGDIAETSGAMQGGFRRSKGTGFKENDVMKGIEEKTIAVTEESQVLSTLEQRRTENDDSITSLREKRASLEGDIIKAERSLHLDPEDMNQNSIIKEELNEQIKEVDSEIENVEEVVSEVNGKIAKLKMDKHELRSRMNEVRSPTLLAELNAFDEKKTSLKETVLQIDADMRSVNTEINDLKLPERERIQIILKQMEKEEVSFSEEISSLGSSISDKNISLTEKEKEAEDFYAKYKGLFVQRTQIGDTITQIEHQVDIVREKSKDVEIEMNQKSIHNAEISGKLAGLEEEFRRYEGVELVDRSEEDLKSEISKFERMVIEIGNVNMRALEVYEEIQQEYNSLMNKKDVLASEKGEVIKMMDEIEHKKKALFMQSFNEINGHFKNIFGELNTKGEASLELDNPEDPLSGGLTVKVKIVGKKFMDLRSLSGGEKTMTALAFIFAIQESDPHSFYIMDEVDASLDKHNSEKLAKLIRKYTQKAQYIVISHNDAVISESDNLYGVSMNEHSISQVTTLKI